jgi:hypothetical protein
LRNEVYPLLAGVYPGYVDRMRSAGVARARAQSSLEQP